MPELLLSQQPGALVKFDTRSDLKGWGAGPRRALFQDTWEMLGVLWHSEILPKHFKHSAVKEYGYKKRHVLYEKRKQKRWGHRYPLVWSGDTKRRLEASARIRSSSKGSKVTMLGPKHFYQYRKDLGQPDKAAEVRKISQADADFLTAAADEYITGVLQDSTKSAEYKTRFTRRRRVAA